MKIKFIYIKSECNQQFGHIVSIRTGTQTEADSIPYPAAVFNIKNIGIADVCSVTDWIEVSENDLESIFVRGEKTINADGCLCDVIDQERSYAYLASLEEEAESEASNG